jgi:hypothetical protein
LPVLATQADATAYGYPVIADTWYVRASARVRRFLRQEITQSTSSTVLSGSGPWLLPQRPVVAVTSVVDKDANPVTFEVDGPWLCAPRRGPLTVTYTHGFNPVPDDLVELVCFIAARMSGVPDAVAAGARTEQAGAEAVTWGVEAFNASSGLTTGEEEELRKIYPRIPRTTVLRPAPLRWRP